MHRHPRLRHAWVLCKHHALENLRAGPGLFLLVATLVGITARLLVGPAAL